MREALHGSVVGLPVLFGVLCGSECRVEGQEAPSSDIRSGDQRKLSLGKSSTANNAGIIS